MKLVKFENTGCPSCDRAKLFLNAVGGSDVVVSKMPYVEADDAILAGTLTQPIMTFPTFIVMIEDGDGELKEVEGKRMDGFDPSRSGELLELVEFVKSKK